jgi:two-component system chemotaxis response regulator CheB
MNRHPKFAIVIGASAGGLNALTEFVSQLKSDMDASIFIVMHLSRKGISDFLVHRLQQYTLLPCEIARDQAPIEKGKIYIASPNHHLLIKEDRIIIGYGPEENRWRPSINVLFRSAAVSFGNYCIGIILTGLLDDGTSGMIAIKRCGGVCIVQDPNEAEYPDMPLAVLNSMEVDYCISLADMGFTLKELTKNGIVQTKDIPEDIRREAEIAEKAATGIDVVNAMGVQIPCSCPDCGGTLWSLTEGTNTKYRCHVGHSYSEADLVIKQAHYLEATLWVALRMMEERKNLLYKLEKDSRKRGANTIASGHEEKKNELQAHIDRLKEILFETQDINP